MSVIKKVAATAAAIVLGVGVLTPTAGAQEEPVVETVSPAPEAVDTTTTLPPGTVTQAPAASASPSKDQAAEPSAAPKPEPNPAPAADPGKPVAGPAAEGARECTPAVSVEGGQVLRSWSKVNVTFAGCGMEAGEVATATFPENSALNFQEGVYDIFLKDSNRKVGTIEASAGRATFRFEENVSHWTANIYTGVRQVETGDLSIITDFNGVSKTHAVGNRVLDCGAEDCQPPREAGAHEKWASFENGRGQIAYQLWLVSNESSVTFSDKITDGNSEFLCDSLRPAAFENKGRKSNKAQIGQKLDVKADVQCSTTEWTVTFTNVPANTWLQVDGWARPLNKGLVDEARGLHYYGDTGTIAGKPWNAKAFVFGGGGTAWQALPPAPKTTPPAPSSTPSTPAKPSSSKPAPAPSSSKTTTPATSTPKPPATTEPAPGSSSGGGKGGSSSSSNYFGSAAGSSSRLITAALSSGNSWLLSCFPFLFGWGSATGSAAGSAAGSSKVTPAPARPAAPVQQAPVAAPAITPVAHQAPADQPAPQPQAASRTALANTGVSGVQTALAMAGLALLGGAALLVQRKRS
ncbi:LPXTG cell wall anchor domain-containing protein [Candidatus Saccharibacteria bacterium]|nr:LPXTG cell wall anchor domain-containing protein [Candidatus Saccharibacteria bacterium]